LVAGDARHVKGEGMSVQRFVSNSSKETIAIGGEIAQQLSPPMLLFLRGDLGAGKTTLVKGIAQALDAADPDEVTSPTFTLVHEYDGRTLVDNRITVDGKEHDVRQHDIKLYHIDLYRIEDERQLETIGMDELATQQAILLVEWGEKFPSVVKRSNGEIVIEHAGGDTRNITLTLNEKGTGA
jgi:tRNA threonylcarbamoyladenosine biosynthesis protein TsaE